MPATYFQTTLVRGHPLVPDSASELGLQRLIEGLYHQSVNYVDGPEQRLVPQISRRPWGVD